MLSFCSEVWQCLGLVLPHPKDGVFPFLPSPPPLLFFFPLFFSFFFSLSMLCPWVLTRCCSTAQGKPFLCRPAVLLGGQGKPLLSKPCKTPAGLCLRRADHLIRLPRESCFLRPSPHAVSGKTAPRACQRPPRDEMNRHVFF